MNFKKIILSLLCLIIGLTKAGLYVYAEEQKPVIIVINGEILQTDVPPIIKESRTLVPLRAIFEKLEMSVEWNATSITTYRTTGDGRKFDFIQLSIGNKNAIVFNQRVTMDVPPIIQDGRTLVPLRFLVENLGLDVKWDAPNRTVTVKYKSFGLYGHGNVIKTSESDGKSLSTPPNFIKLKDLGDDVDYGIAVNSSNVVCAISKKDLSISNSITIDGDLSYLNELHVYKNKAFLLINFDIIELDLSCNKLTKLINGYSVENIDDSKIYLASKKLGICAIDMETSSIISTPPLTGNFSVIFMNKNITMYVQYTELTELGNADIHTLVSGEDKIILSVESYNEFLDSVYPHDKKIFFSVNSAKEVYALELTNNILSKLPVTFYSNIIFSSGKIYGFDKEGIGYFDISSFQFIRLSKASFFTSNISSFMLSQIENDGTIKLIQLVGKQGHQDVYRYNYFPKEKKVVLTSLILGDLNRIGMSESTRASKIGDITILNY